MKKVQLVIFILALITSIVYMIFVLGFSTNYAIGAGYLGDFYQDAQKANKHMFDLGLWIIILVGANFLLHSQKNKKFYISNFVVSISLSILMMFAAITTYGYMGPLKASFDQISEGNLLILSIINGGETTTKNLDQGVTISYILFVQGILVLGITMYKLYTNIIRVKMKNKRKEALQ